MIMDLGLPGIDGIEATRRIRTWSQVPVIVLSVRDAHADKVAALDAGADDYVTKPFAIEEVLARIRAVSRRAAPGPAASPSCGSATWRWTWASGASRARARAST